MKKQELRKIQEHSANQVLEGMISGGKLKDVFKRKTKKLKK